MADAHDLNASGARPATDRPSVSGAAASASYQGALAKYEGVRLYEIARGLGLADPGVKPRSLSTLIADHLGTPKAAERALSTLEPAQRLVLGVFAVTESPSWPLLGLLHALSCLAVDPKTTLPGLLERGLVVLDFADGAFVSDLARLIDSGTAGDVSVCAHPAVVSGARTVLPEPRLEGRDGPVRQLREADGLEPILRLAALWQRVDEAPLRRTQQGTLYKRDRDRLEDDRVLAGPITDVIEPLPDMAGLWFALARRIGLLVDDPSTDRIVAAPAEFWVENAFHLPQMIATRWLALRDWHEQAGMKLEGSPAELALPYVRPVALLWLATAPEERWVPLEELAALLRNWCPDWDRPTLGSEAAALPSLRTRPGRSKGDGRAPKSRSDASALEAALLGAAYQLGLVRAAEDAESGQRLVQLTPLGRYILALGPPPPARPSFEHFLFVQPNFEMIAYRQGLTPALIGQLSRFAHCSQVGAALELKLTAESVYRGLEGGLTTQQMLDRLARHSARALPAGVAEAFRTWSGRRERVTYYAGTTLMEFATHLDLEAALLVWPEGARVAPVVVADRLLLVEDEASIPFQRLKLTGARDYRRDPEVCLDVESDGVTLSLDLSRSDLLVTAELARFSEELPRDATKGTPGNPRRWFRVTTASLARAAESGLSRVPLSQWYERRTGAETPPAVRLLLLAHEGRIPPLTTRRPLLLHTPSVELLDGLVQHPDTRIHIGERLGPTCAIVPDEALSALRRVLAELGLGLLDPQASGSTGGLELFVPSAAARPKRM